MKVRKPKFVHDWHEAHRWASMRGMSVGTVLTAAAGSAALAGGAASWITVFDLGIVLLLASGIFVVSMVGRLLLQKRKGDGDG